MLRFKKLQWNLKTGCKKVKADQKFKPKISIYFNDIQIINSPKSVFWMRGK
jgi:predicted nucleic acid-binding protein